MQDNDLTVADIANAVQIMERDRAAMDARFPGCEHRWFVGNTITAADNSPQWYYCPKCGADSRVTTE